VRETYLALLLTADPSWRLEGLQRLHKLGLEKIIGQVIENGELPE